MALQPHGSGRKSTTIVTEDEAIFAEAVTKGSPSARADYLNQACAGRAELRRVVDRLLAAHDRAGGILEVPPVGLEVTSEVQTSSEGVGASVGPYKLLEQIGGGGMGVV